MRSLIYIVINICFSLQVRSQPWTFEKCVAYAEAHNIQLDLAKLQQEQAKYSYEQSRNLRLPTLNSSVSSAYNFGLSENPTTGILVNRKNFGVTIGLQSEITLFNWFSLLNSMEAARFTYEAENFLLQAAYNDLRFNILVGYLKTLQAREQEKIASYPSEEYGYVEGVVDYISDMPNRKDSFRVKARLPKGLATNYRKTVLFKNELVADAEIITADRRLIERFFTQLLKILQK